MFLATTAIEEFWDTKQKIIFLGEWCKLFERRQTWESLQYETVPFIWNNAKDILSAIEYCNKVYENTLKELTNTLNDYHDLRKDTHYYRIILGEWLFQFIHQLYDKYLTLKKAMAMYPDARTWLLDSEQFYIPLEYNDYTENSIGDKYSLQLYSQILRALGYDYPEKKLAAPLEEGVLHNPSNLYKDNLLSFLAKISTQISCLLHKKTLSLTLPGISYKDLLRLIVKSKFRCIFEPLIYRINIQYDVIDKTFRGKKLSSGEDEFQSILAKIILGNLPILFVEGFRQYRKAVLELPIHRSAAFFTAHALHGNYVFKFYAAEHCKNIKLLGMQHGGGYGLDYICMSEEYERSVVDRFYTAGWEKDTKTVPLPVPKFYKKNVNGCSQKDGYFLFSMVEMPRYVHRIDLHPMSTNWLQLCLNTSMVFLQHFQQRKNLLIRAYARHFGWKTVERISAEFNDCLFDDFSQSFDRRLADARICIFDHVHTTWMESLASNKPTVVFISDKIQYFHPDAQPYIDMLRSVNILHYSPESAASHLNSIIDNSDEWWLTGDVQSARKEFVKHYALGGKNWIDQWIEEFETVLNGN